LYDSAGAPGNALLDAQVAAVAFSSLRSHQQRGAMNTEGTKEAAEAVLRELPSVIGAFVREDINGHPREVHLLVRAGPNARHLAYDVRDLLEERLGVPIDQRVISIAQLAEGRRPGPELASAAGMNADSAVTPVASATPTGPATLTGPATPMGPATSSASAVHADSGPAVAAAQGPGSTAPVAAAQPAAAVPEVESAGPAADLAPELEPRVRFAAISIEAMDNRVRARVSLDFNGEERIGEALGLDTEPARLRTAAAATLIAVDSTCVGRSRFEVEHVAVETAFGREYVLVSVLASSPYLGRRPIPLAGAHPVDMDAESAAALAALKAVNRTLSLVLRLPESRGPRARPTSRRS
jgi:hypothetical protein